LRKDPSLSVHGLKRSKRGLYALRRRGGESTSKGVGPLKKPAKAAVQLPGSAKLVRTSRGKKRQRQEMKGGEGKTGESRASSVSTTINGKGSRLFRSFFV